MDKKFQVFVSSTYADLKDERSKVIQTLMEMDCIPSGMELFPAADEEQWNFIKKVIDDCDFYLLIVGGRYGSIDSTGLSYTEKEYDYAVEKGIKVIAFLHRNPEDLPRSKTDHNPEFNNKLKLFRDKISKSRMVKFWTKTEELPGLVALSLQKTVKTSQAVGWIRADQINNITKNINVKIDPLINAISTLDINNQNIIKEYIQFIKAIENINNPNIKQRLKNKFIENSFDLKYIVLGSQAIYEHDQYIINKMDKGETYRATHPFSSNKEAHFKETAQFTAYINSQISAAERGVDVRRLYIAPFENINKLEKLEIDHLYLIKNTKINLKIIPSSTIHRGGLCDDFVIFDNCLLGTAFPPTGEMLGSEYEFCSGDTKGNLHKYSAYFDMLYNAAKYFNDFIDSNVDKNTNKYFGFQGLKHSFEPAFSLQNPVNINGKPTKRLMVVLRTAGCKYNRNNNGCTMCGFNRHATNKSEVTLETLMHQLEGTMAESNFGPYGASQIDLLTLGSFLHDKEVPYDFQKQAMQRLSKESELKKIVIESRASYIDELKLERLKGILRNDQILEVGLGIETMNERIRNGILNKNLTNAEILRTLDACVSTNVEFMAYLLIGTMSLSENEMISDAIQSAIKIADICHKKQLRFRIAFEPVFITHGTKLGDMFSRNEYRIINLWRVIDVIKATYDLGTIFIGMSDEGLSNHCIPQSCNLCNDTLRAAIEKFNGTQSLDEINTLSCNCSESFFMPRN